MDLHANDCPCKRQRVSEGDETDQETGMLLHATGHDENIDPSERGALVNENEIFTVDHALLTIASGDSTNNNHLSKKLSHSVNNPGNFGDGQSELCTSFRLNQSTKKSDCEYLHENECAEGAEEAGPRFQSENSMAGPRFQSENAMAGLRLQSENAMAEPRFQSENTEADMHSASNSLQYNSKDLKTRQFSGVCEYVKNVQAIAECSYIRTRDRNTYQSTFESVSSLESPKLKRTLDRINTNIVKQRIETSAFPQVEKDTFNKTSSELKSLACYDKASGMSHSGTVQVYKLKEWTELNREEHLAEFDTGKKNLTDRMHSVHEVERLKETDVSEENGSVFKENVEEVPFTDESMAERKSNGSSLNKDNGKIREASLDDSGFIEMFSNSVMGNIMCGNGNGGSYRNYGRRGILKDSGKATKYSNMTSDKDRFRNVKDDTSINVPLFSPRTNSQCSNLDLNESTEVNQGNSTDTCKFGELGNILKDIGQIDDNTKTSVDRRKTDKGKADNASVGHGTSEYGHGLKGSGPEVVSESIKGTEKVKGVNKEQETCSSESFTSVSASFFVSVLSANSTREEAGKSLGEETSENGPDGLNHVNIKSSDDNTKQLNVKCEPCTSLVNGRFKLDYDQTQEIISQSIINSLPMTVLVQIFKNLTVFELLHRASLVCRYWYNLCRDPDIWRNICLVNQHRLSDYNLETVLSFSDYRVRKINLTDCRFVTDKGIRFLVKNCPQIEVLKVMRCFDLTDMAFEGIYSLYLCRNLQALFMDGCCRITDKTVQEVAESCRELRTLHLNQCTRISDAGVITVAKRCPHLTDFQLDHCSQVTDEGISELVMGCPNIQYLNLMCCGITNTGVKYLAKLSKLMNLDLSNIPRLTSDSVVYLSKFCRNLQCINVSLNTVMDDDCIAQLAMNLPLLKRLYCVSCSISDKGLEDIAKYCPSLQALDVGWCQEVTDHGVRVISLACKRLDYFGLIRCDRVTIETIEELVLKYPKINYSTFILESRRLLERARNEGYMFNLPSVS